MGEFTLFILGALALVLVIEGLIYAIFPDQVRKMMAMAVMMPVNQLRSAGLVMALAGLTIVAILRWVQGG
jgi:hypothetical protein